MATQTVQATSGNWTFTMPDQVTLSQGGATTGLALNGGTEPLVIDVRLNADLLFGSSEYHGIISIKMDDMPGGESAADIVNGLRGPIQIVLHNELGFAISNPPGDNNTMAIYLAGNSDLFPASPAPADAFHTLYTHFHGVEPTDFPGLALSKQVGPFVGAFPGDRDGAPNWLGLDGAVAPGTHTWGPFTFHRRDTDADDDATLNIIFFNGALDPAAVAALKAQWEFERNPPALSVADVSAAEGNSNPAGVLNFAVTLSRAAPVPVTVQYATADGTAAASADYIPASGSVTFAPGEVGKTVPVTVLGDTGVEPDETVTLTLSGATAPVPIARAAATGTIANDDSPANPSIFVNDVRATEGGALAFEVALSVATTVPVTVAYATADGTATAGGDYTAASGTLSFAAGETRKTVTVQTAQDATFENDETLTLTLSAPTNGTLLRAAATGTIVNDDTAPAPTPTQPTPTPGSDSFTVNGAPQAGTPYTGPVSYLQLQFLGSAQGEVVLGTARNDFLNLLDGTDAADGGAGDDVIDGGLGSNFLTGGAGRDVFFLDGRGGGVTWSTITDWQAGEELSLWGWRPGASRAQWVDSAGAQGFQGATMHADLDGNGTIDASVTWANRARSGLPTPTEHDGLLWFHP